MQVLLKKKMLGLNSKWRRVLLMARLDKEAMDLKKERVDVHQIILDSVRHHATALQERKGIVDSRSDGDPG